MASPTPTTATESSRSDEGLLRRFVGAPFRTDTYAKHLYVFLAFPLAVIVEFGSGHLLKGPVIAGGLMTATLLNLDRSTGITE